MTEITIVSQTSPPSRSPPHMVVPSSILWQKINSPITVLIDSSADDSFICTGLVQQLQLPLEPLPSPKRVSALDGCHISLVPHQTAPSTLIISPLSTEKPLNC